MENNSEPVWIMFITDTETRDKLLKYGSGSQWEVDALYRRGDDFGRSGGADALPDGSTARARGQRDVDDRPRKRLSDFQIPRSLAIIVFMISVVPP